jgi:hypothetical protein
MCCFCFWGLGLGLLGQVQIFWLFGSLRDGLVRVVAGFGKLTMGFGFPRGNDEIRFKSAFGYVILHVKKCKFKLNSQKYIVSILFIHE